MKWILNILFIFILMQAFSQSKNCSCIVKTDKVNLDHKLLLNHLKEKPPAEAPKPYIFLYPEGNNEFATHNIIKDSSSFWFIQPHVNSVKKYDVFKMNKLSTFFYVQLKFNNADSIPVYSEADSNSKIIYHIKHDKEKSFNQRWFVACKGNYAKILLLEKQSQTGWIKKENYANE